MKNLTTNEIRNMWLEFFKERGHNVEESASLIPNNDPTLLWINAGVAPLKSYFDGSSIPSNPRIVNAQKCIRTNDIDNVGETSRHQTFFEMLGNFSIGDYFRDEIIPWAFELLTSDKYYGFDKDLLYMTVYHEDTATYKKWLDIGVEESHIIKSIHNFWEIGSGPCGPDTEIFYDRGDSYGVEDISLIEHDIDNERYIEIWNIVFSQFNSVPGTSREDYKELPQQNIDTGMGLERMSCILQGAETNFETDLFLPIIEVVEELSNITYKGQKSFKVIVDHIRTVTFAISDGAVLSNDGRGYVLRRLLRRALKHGKQLGIKKAFLYKLVDKVVEVMEEYYPYLNDQTELVKKVVKIEEEKFLETLTLGEKLLEGILKKEDKGIISGVDAFTMYDTYGFPVELTVEMAENEGFTVDLDGFNTEMEKQKERARGARKSIASMKEQNEEFLKFKKESSFTGYDSLSEETYVLKSFDEGVVLKSTPFYAESGGQVADLGVIKNNEFTVDVIDVLKLPNGQFLHYLADNPFKDDEEVVAVVDEESRNLTVYNHSATHILFKALREIVGPHVSQQGSQVTSEYLRFDFNNFQMLTDELLLKVENRVNEIIKENIEVDITVKTIDEAKAMGAIAEFGEKYGSEVRVINMGYTVDLCGGTHVKNTGVIEKFAIASIESKGSGVYRIVGHANKSVNNIKNQFTGFHKEMDKLLLKASKILTEAKAKKIKLAFKYVINQNILGSYQDIINKRIEFEHLNTIVRELEKEYKEKTKSLVMNDLDSYLSQTVNNRLVIKTENIEKDSLKPLADRLLENIGEGFVFIANIANSKVTFIVKTNIDSLHAGNIAKAAAITTGGNGGGRKDMAQAGGKDIALVDQAILEVKELVK
ncbi:MAG: alanine--tRNA ligase [Candidatus Izemoplasma sp.]